MEAGEAGVEILRQTSDPTTLSPSDIVRAVEVVEDLRPHAEKDPKVCAFFMILQYTSLE